MNEPNVKLLWVDVLQENLIALEALLRRDGFSCRGTGRGRLGAKRRTPTGSARQWETLLR